MAALMMSRWRPLGTYLPVLDGALPLGDLVDVLQPPLPLVDEPRYVLHGVQGRLHVLVIPVGG